MPYMYGHIRIIIYIVKFRLATVQKSKHSFKYINEFTYTMVTLLQENKSYRVLKFNFELKPLILAVYMYIENMSLFVTS